MSARSSSSSAAPLGTDSELAQRFQQRRDEALKFARDGGWYEDCLVEVPVAWGQQDANAHVNNAVYFRFLETGRLNLVRALSDALPENQAKDMRGSGKGKGVILARISFDYKRPTTYPDTVLVLHKALRISSRRLQLQHAVYSYNQQAVVGTGEAVVVAYDYDQLKSTEWPEAVVELVTRRGAQAVDGKL
ncbi:hypothetical protein JCM1841_002849 [Sporobolomyces salmonicolor]